MAGAPVHVSISPDVITYIGSFPITNTLITSWIVIVVLTALSWLLTRNISSLPSKKQAIGEEIIEGLLNFFTMVSGSRERALKHFPIVATLFLYILFSNWLGIFPGVGTIGYWHESHHEDTEKAHAHTLQELEHKKDVLPEVIVSSASSSTNPVISSVTSSSSPDTHSPLLTNTTSSVIQHSSEKKESHSSNDTTKILTPLFRSVNSDLNMTLALALFVVVVSHVIGISHLGAYHHISKFFNFSNPINFFVGILELIGELSRMISFSFRLFGNIFAGEVLLVIISFLVPFLVPLPFLGLELFVGVVQAAIFSTLAIIFIGQAETHHE